MVRLEFSTVAPRRDEPVSDMAVFDPSEQRMCVRVVYDGAAGAGKTTNLRQLATLFAAQRTTEVASPVELRGRTLYFDWMEIAAGVVCGFPLMCQVISVPGQVAFSARRKHLLESADVVVYVCDSSDAAVRRAHDAFSVVEGMSGRPIVLQANKQDQPNALDARTILASLGRDLPVVEAIAADGIGVVDTFVTAVRTVARRLQVQTEREGLRVPVRLADSMNEVLASVVAAPIDRFGAAELLLEEASAAFLFAEPVAKPSHPVTTEGAPSVVDAPLPNADVPTGFVWPAHTGRAILRALAPEDAVRSAGNEWTIGDRVLSTSPDLRFDEPDAARQALVRAARERTQLEGLLVADTVLVVQAATDGTSWLWTVRPKLRELHAWLDEERTRLQALGAAVAMAANVALRHGLAFTSGFTAFGLQNGTIRYGGALVATDSAGEAAVRLLEDAVTYVDAFEHDGEAFLEAVERELGRRFAATEATFFLGGFAEARDPRLVAALGRIAQRDRKSADHVAA